MNKMKVFCKSGEKFLLCNPTEHNNKLSQWSFFMRHFSKILAIFLIGVSLVLTSCARPPKKCGSMEYRSYGQFCYEEKVYGKCGLTVNDLSSYDPSTQGCSDGIIVPKCGSDLYDPSTHYCKFGTTLTDCSTFVDERDGKTYKYVTIGTQTWMAENLNYTPRRGNSWCYKNKESECVRYGRLYDWQTAMAGSAGSKTNPSGVQGVCPNGWHLPSDAEWTELVTFVENDGGCTSCAWKKLKAASNWSSGGNGTDDYGFSALPGGIFNTDIADMFGLNAFREVGFSGYWWSSSDGSGMVPAAYNRSMASSHEKIYQKDGNSLKVKGHSIRCVQD
jgi:uncharacterized protein (TIGR02145 family)